ncbi:UDP-N-acetylmuramate--L-alanine ligase [Bacteroidia bacterium]|nr:UDP-N-acetylmuramate--L-alanine ligase [Bacteroidia bacterium]
MGTNFADNFTDNSADTVTGTFADTKNVYFLGIGGIGMSALAFYFKANKYDVSGYDKTPSPLTEQLIGDGIAVNYLDEERAIESKYLDPATTLLVYTPAIPKDNQQLNVFLKAGFTPHKRSEVLGIVSRNKKALCVAGTHGKTTITTMLAYLLKNSSVGCNAFLGGLSMNFGSNLLLDEKSDYVVIEADEFDRSFLRLQPEIAVITAMDADHLDIYNDKESMVEAFNQFAALVREGGKLFLKQGLHITSRSCDGVYAIGKEADYYSDNLHIAEGHFDNPYDNSYVFDFHWPGGTMRGLRSGIPGRVNVENATAAIMVALQVGVTEQEIRAALPNFRGVKRRFNILSKGTICNEAMNSAAAGKGACSLVNRVTYIDDYAHHPKEIEAVLTSVREMWPDKKLTVAFQPHLFTRTRDFHTEFARSLDIADSVLLLDIYPARELPLAGVTSEIIRKNLHVPSVIVSKEEFVEFVKAEVTEGIFMTLGAGDIDRFVNVFAEMFEEATAPK